MPDRLGPRQQHLLSLLHTGIAGATVGPSGSGGLTAPADLCRSLERRGLLHRDASSRWAMTDAGRAALDPTPAPTAEE